MTVPSPHSVTDTALAPVMPAALAPLAQPQRVGGQDSVRCVRHEDGPDLSRPTEVHVDMQRMLSVGRELSRGCTPRIYTASMAFTPDSGGLGTPLLPPHAGLRPDPFPDRAASLLPGLLAATGTGLTPAGDDELTNLGHLQQVTSVPLAHERPRLGSAI